MLPSAAGKIQRASTASYSFIRIARHQAFQHHALRAHVRWLAHVAEKPLEKHPSLALPSTARYNDIDVQQLSSHVYKQIFPDGETPPSPELVKLCKDHLNRHNLLGKNTDRSDPIAFDLPPLQGRTLDEHFFKLGTDSAEPFLQYAKTFASASIPEKPKKWVRQSGWTMYCKRKEEGIEIEAPGVKIEAPDESMLCFDTEVMWKDNPFPVMACAFSHTAWYAWISPWLLGESESRRHLIPLGDPSKDRIIVGHNVGYDRARVAEEYNLKQSRNSFLDTMSLHVAVNGMCSQQRPTWLKHRKDRELGEKRALDRPSSAPDERLGHEDTNEQEELWIGKSSINSLRDVAQFHLQITIDKAVRDEFGSLDREDIRANLDTLLDYCAEDVITTHKVYQIVFPNFLKVCPHPVSFAALRHLSSAILPINKTWDDYVNNADGIYTKLSNGVRERLVALAEQACKVKDNPEIYQNDPWMQQLDWSGQDIRRVKAKEEGELGRPVARQKKPGMPKWYKQLFATNDSPMNISVRTRISPLLLKLCWDGHPLFWSGKYGWTFRVPLEQRDKYADKSMVECIFDEKEPNLRDDVAHSYFKIPHKDGPTARCTNPMAKSYLAYFENGILSSEYSYAKEALEMNASCSYWISARHRIKSQMAVYENDEQGEAPSAAGEGEVEIAKDNSKIRGFILPQIIPMGTITRRAVENTWLTASNSKKNRVGSELKAMVKAPEGYYFVGADVDSEELWIASLVGDATFKIHGGNAVGFMTLEGTKSAGTDLHSRTAAILGITRNDAKVFNYGRIYGAGLKFAATLLRQFNPSLSEKETIEIAGKLYANTKGTKTNRRTLYKRTFWRGGTESFVFNKLEEFAEQERPRTPVLGAGITEALRASYLSKGGYLTSRINWAIQSSGVDYLHLLVVGMDYLIRRFNIDARIAITVHDEIRYLVKNEDKYRAAMALQVVNLWTRAMFAQQMGINDLPQSCAYFSAVDIDHVLRKEVDMDCITPSHSTPIPYGESIDINALLDKGEAARLDPMIVPHADHAPNLEGIEYTDRVPVMQAIQKSAGETLPFLKAQIVDSEQELADIIREKRRAELAAIPKAARPMSQSTLKKVLPYQAKPHLMPTGKNMLFQGAPNSNNQNGYNGTKWTSPSKNGSNKKSWPTTRT